MPARLEPQMKRPQVIPPVFRQAFRLMLLLAVHAASARAATWPDKWGVRGIEEGAVRFTVPDGALAPSPLKLSALGIKDSQLVGALDSGEKSPPYLILTGSNQTSAEKALFLVRADGLIKPQRVTYPGRLLDPKTRELVYESRVFYGRCLMNQKYDALIAYQREHMDRKRGLQSSVYIAEAAPSMLDERLLERGLPSLKMIQMRIKSKQCIEISGRHRPFDAQFFSLRSRRGTEVQDNDEDDEDEKEKGDKAKDKESLKKAEFETD